MPYVYIDTARSHNTDKKVIPLEIVKDRKTIITIAVVAVIAISVFAVFVNLNGGSADFSDREVRVIITDSMDGEPHPEYTISTIPKDSLVMVRMVSDSEKADIQVGDVVQFRVGGILNHHRVIENHPESGYMITQGDNTTSDDGHISYDRVRGVVVGVNHPLGEVFLFVKVYAIFLLILLVVIFIAAKLVEEIRREKNEQGKI